VSNCAQEFVAVRVQDPRVRNEGSWNSFVDYKIFLHTNSKAFTAKTSCVRRRYSEFVWLKKQLQKNAGLVPVPDLPAKSIFYYWNEDFLEGRRKGLQAFLDKVVHMTVCLSDSQLHLFLQTQLSLAHIQDCVQGHTPFTVTDAILTYASSNQGFAQAQQEEPAKESELAVSYESTESPAPHQPSLLAQEVRPDLLLGPDSHQVERFRPAPRGGLEHKEKPLIRVLQKNGQMEAVLEEWSGAGVSFFLGDDHAEPERPGLEDRSQLRGCRLQTPVQVHSTAGAGSEVGCEVEQSVTLSLEEKTVPSDAEEQPDPPREEEEEEEKGSLPDLDYLDAEAQGVLDLERVAEVKNEEEKQAEITERARAEPEINVDRLERSEDTQVERRADDKDEDGRSLPSSNGSIAKVSDEESDCEEVRDFNQDEKCCSKACGQEAPLWPTDDSIRNITDVHSNGRAQDEEPQDQARASHLGQSVFMNSTPTSGDQTENSDFSIIETSCSPGNS
uniref:Sorting nexin 11 n=1 Tax=Tetraodon nigroviridis TaxID=99883 RepID=H3CXK8_TETNG